MLAYARETVRDPDGDRCGSGCAGGRRWRCCGRWPPSPAAAAATLRNRAANVDAADVEEADGSAAAQCSTCADDETAESADVTPGADGDDADGRHARTGRRLRRFAAGPTAARRRARPKLALLDRDRQGAARDGYHPIVFCRFIATAEYVAEHLRQRLGNGYAVAP